MNVFKRFYCRVYQGAFRLMLPLLPYRQPKILQTDEDVVAVLQEKGIEKVLLVTDKGIRGLGLTKSLEDMISKAGVGLFVYDETVPNPTTANVADAVNRLSKYIESELELPCQADLLQKIKEMQVILEKEGVHDV